MPYKFDWVAIAKRQGPNIAPNEYGCRLWLSRAIPYGNYPPLPNLLVPVTRERLGAEAIFETVAKKW
jgi:hypothetical protein